MAVKLPQMYSRLQVLLAVAVTAALAVSATISVCNINLAVLGLGSEPAGMQAVDEVYLDRKFLELSEDMFKVRRRQLKAYEEQDSGLRIDFLNANCSNDAYLNLRRLWKVTGDDSDLCCSHLQSLLFLFP